MTIFAYIKCIFSTFSIFKSLENLALIQLRIYMYNALLLF